MNTEQLIADVQRYLEAADARAKSENFDESHQQHVGRALAASAVIALLKGSSIDELLDIYDEGYPL